MVTAAEPTDNQKREWIKSSDNKLSLVPNPASKKVDIYNLFQEMKDNETLADFLEVYRISDDDKLERISYSIYGTADYWDILLQINDRNPLFQMPYNLDATFDIAESMWNNYSDNVYFQSPLDSNLLQSLIDEEIERLKEKNEFYRFIYIIKTSKMNEFLKILRERYYIL